MHLPDAELRMWRRSPADEAAESINSHEGNLPDSVFSARGWYFYRLERQPAETTSEIAAVQPDETLTSHPLNALGPTGGMRDQAVLDELYRPGGILGFLRERVARAEAAHQPQRGGTKEKDNLLSSSSSSSSSIESDMPPVPPVHHPTTPRTPRGAAAAIAMTPPGTARAYITKQFVGASPLKSQLSQMEPAAASWRNAPVGEYPPPVQLPGGAAQDLSVRMQEAEQAARQDLPDPLRINSAVRPSPTLTALPPTIQQGSSWKLEVSSPDGSTPTCVIDTAWRWVGTEVRFRGERQAEAARADAAARAPWGIVPAASVVQPTHGYRSHHHASGHGASARVHLVHQRNPAARAFRSFGQLAARLCRLRATGGLPTVAARAPRRLGAAATGRPIRLHAAKARSGAPM